MEKNITFPTDRKLCFKALKLLVKKARAYKLRLRQTYTRKALYAFVWSGRYSHARQTKRANRELRKLKTYLGRVIRDVERQITGNELEENFTELLTLAKKVHTQKRKDNHKVYSLHEPHTECICKGKAHKKYEFGCKVSIVMTEKEGVVLEARALHGNPYDGHTLEEAIKQAEKTSHQEIERILIDKGYKGHTVEGKEVFISGQKRLTKHFKKVLKRRQAIEPHIGHMKSDGKLKRNFLRKEIGDQLNAFLVGIGHNLRLLRRFLYKPPPKKV
ncbi:MAG: IS5 family transposase [Acidimicrobiales bacterium]|nr:IS5 family transposase [Acidimicrobiales bacterium]